jgi:hypothetical protein
LLASTATDLNDFGVREKSPGWALASFNVNGNAPEADGVAMLAPKLPANPCFSKSPMPLCYVMLLGGDRPRD